MPLGVFAALKARIEVGIDYQTLPSGDLRCQDCFRVTPSNAPAPDAVHDDDCLAWRLQQWVVQQPEWETAQVD